MASIMGVGWYGAFWLAMLAFVPFYLQTWEEYYRKEMILPVFNGPTEGILILVGMSFTSFFLGSEWYLQVTTCILVITRILENIFVCEINSLIIT